MQRPNLDRMIAGWRGPLLAALVAFIAGLPGLFLTPVVDRTEARVAEVSARMLNTGDLIDVRFSDDDRHRTAAGLHWLQAASAALGSESTDRDIRPYRLPSLLGAMLAAAACAWGGAALFGARAGFLAGALLGSSFLLSSLAGVAQPGALVAGTATLSLAALAQLYVRSRHDEAEAAASGGAPQRLPRSLKLAFWGGLGASLMVGGGVALMIVALTVATLGLWDRRWGWIGRLGWGWGLPLLALILGPWMIAATVTTDSEIWRQVLQDSLPARIAQGQVEWGVPGRHLLVTPLLLFPATLMLPAALATGLTRRAEPAIRFTVAWLAPAWIVFELAPDHQWHQTLPLYAPLAWLAAAALVRPLGRFSRWAGTALAVLGGLYVLGAALYALSEFGGEASQAWATPTIGLTLAAAGIGGFLLYHRMAVTAVLASMVLGVLAHASLAGMVRNLEPLWVSPRLNEAMIATGLHPVEGRYPGPVAVVGYAQPSVTFLFGSGAQMTDAEGASRAVAQGRPAVVEARHESAFRRALSAMGGEARAEGRVTGVNYANGDRVEMVLYRPAVQPAAPRRRAAPSLPAPQELTEEQAVLLDEAPIPEPSAPEASAPVAESSAEPSDRERNDLIELAPPQETPEP